MAKTEKVPTAPEDKEKKKQAALAKRATDVENAIQAFENVFLVKNPQRASLLKSMSKTNVFKLTKSEFESAVTSSRLNQKQVDELLEAGFLRTYAVSTGTGRSRTEGHSTNLASLIEGADASIAAAAKRVQDNINAWRKANEADCKLIFEKGNVNVQFYVRDTSGKNKRTESTTK